MKVKELIAQLGEHDGELEVVVAEDPEGNGYAPVLGMWKGSYCDADRGEMHLSELTPEYTRQGYTEEDVRRPGVDGAIAALCLTP